MSGTGFGLTGVMPDLLDTLARGAGASPANLHASEDVEE
jgi:hypothetical protein